MTGPLQWQSGEKYAYDNQGMNIAARIVEVASGMAYEEFLQKRFLAQVSGFRLANYGRRDLLLR